MPMGGSRGVDDAQFMNSEIKSSCLRIIADDVVLT
jgi:hypothetical protein